jgi:hypothetical protein
MAEEAKAGKKEGGITKELVQAIIVALLMFVFFEPVIKFTWNWMLRVGTWGYTGFLDKLYQNAALGNRNWVDVLFVMGLFTLAVITIFILTLRFMMPTSPQILYKHNPFRKLSPKKLKIIFVICALTMVLCLWVPAFSIYIDLQLNSSFQQRITVLAPLITDQEYKELQASWASMETREDYLAIVESMESLAESHGIKLPKPLVK